MKGDMSTAPTSPPPVAPGVPADDPGVGLPGPAISPQHDVESPSPSSNVVMSRPPSAYAGDAVIIGTQVERKALMPANPPGRLGSLHGLSCPSPHRSGVMKT